MLWNWSVRKLAMNRAVPNPNPIIAATDGDNTNIIVAQIAKRRFNVPTVIARILDPLRAEWYGQQGVETICPTRVAIEMLEARVKEADGDSVRVEEPVLRGLGLFHGKRGYGLSVEFTVKTGPVTILGMTQTAEGRLKLMAAEGESIPGERLAIGNTNSRIRFGLDPAEFMNRWAEQGPTHHCALGIGHQIGKIRKLARLLDLELVVVG